jgi:hypothetical protein
MAGIADEWAAFQFDAAALSLGRQVEKALQNNAARKEGQRRSPLDVVAAVLGTEPAGQAPALPPGPIRNLRPGDKGYDEWLTVFSKEARSKA